jgi:hypothetical protein
MSNIEDFDRVQDELPRFVVMFKVLVTCWHHSCALLQALQSFIKRVLQSMSPMVKLPAQPEISHIMEELKLDPMYENIKVGKRRKILWHSNQGPCRL